MAHLKKGKNKMLLGVCSGLSEYTGIDVTLIRLISIIGTLITGSALFWIYLLFGFLLPKGEE